MNDFTSGGQPVHFESFGLGKLRLKHRALLRFVSSSRIGFPSWGSIRARRILFAIRLELFFGDCFIAIGIGRQNEFAEEASKSCKDFFNRRCTVWSASVRPLDCAARLVAILVASFLMRLSLILFR